jgi:hypothetical protein
MIRGWFLVLAAASAALLAATARAQESFSVAVFRTAAKDSALKPLADALDPVVLGELDKIEGVRVSARPPLDLPATQLALDCIGETSACLRSVAEQAGAETLVAPSLDRAGDETVVTLLFFDARGEGELRSSTRRHPNAEVERAALDALPAMMRELFGVAEPATAPGEPVPAPQQPVVDDTDLGAQEPAAERSSFPPAPVAITAVGAAILGTGIAFGLVSKATEDDLAALPTDTMDEIDAVYDKLDEAQTQATIANVGIGLGAAVIALGVTLWVVELSDAPEAEQSAWLAPRLGPREVGLAVGGRFAVGP